MMVFHRRIRCVLDEGNDYICLHVYLDHKVDHIRWNIPRNVTSGLHYQRLNESFRVTNPWEIRFFKFEALEIGNHSFFLPLLMNGES